MTKSESANKAYELPSEAIKEVVLGCKMRQDDMTAIIEVMDSKFPNARIFEAKTSLESFTLNLHEAVSIK
ncbi:hypothetical protein D3C73_1568880 [compost metagenome]